MNTFKFVIKAAVSALTLVMAVNVFASGALFKHRSSAMLGGTPANSYYCDPDTVCVAIFGDSSIKKPISADFALEAVVDGALYTDVDQADIRQGWSLSSSVDLQAIADLNISKLRQYITTMDGKSVNHLCDISIAGKSLNYTQSIVMTIHTDGHGNYTCKRS